MADLDQDGYVDLVLNDHGFGVRICWNNKGRFAKPYDLIMGDLHGITVGDIDQDGNLELVLSRGGGSGSNARNAKVYRVNRQREFTELRQLATPLQRMRGRTVQLFDGDNDGDLDLINFAFPSRELQGESENYIYRNTGGGNYQLAGTLPAVKGDGQKTLITDFNDDGVPDLLLYGQGPVVLYQGKGGLAFEDVTDAVLPYDLEDVTSVVELDFDNDGDLDLFVTRGKEFEAGETFFDAQASVWGFYTKRGPFQFEDLIVGDILEIENYQAQWPSKALKIGESAYDYEFEGETHSGRDIRLVNSDALGWPDEVSKDASHVGYVGNEAWRLAGDIWSPTSGIIRGVRTYPEYDHPDGLGDVLLANNGSRFFDATARANLVSQDHSTGAVAADFDNDGLQDILVIRRGNLVTPNASLVYLNRGESGFELMPSSGIVSPELGAIGLGAEAFDYDRDGQMDLILGNERGKWHLFNNQWKAAQDNHYLIVEIEHPSSGPATTLDAVVRLKSGDGEQIRRVGTSGAAYSRSNNPFVHFGVGNLQGPVEVEVRWSSGQVATRTVSQLDQIVQMSPE